MEINQFRLELLSLAPKPGGMARQFAGDLLNQNRINES
jgi:hypothetical protein